MKSGVFRACVIIALAVTSAAAVCGCGKKEPPKTVFDKIDYFVNRLDEEVGKLSDTVNALATDIQEGVELTEGVLDEARDEIEAEADKVSDQLDAALEQISEAASRKGTSEYEKFLQIQEEILDNATALMEAVADITAEISSAVETVRTGRAPDTSKLSRSLEEWTSNFHDIERRTQELIDQAKNLR